MKWMFGTLIVLIGRLYAVIFKFALNHASFHRSARAAAIIFFLLDLGDYIMLPGR